MPSWLWRTRRLRMFSSEGASAVGEAISSRGDAARTPTVESQGLSYCGSVAGGAVSRTNGPYRARCAGGDCIK